MKYEYVLNFSPRMFMAPHQFGNSGIKEKKFGKE